MRYRVGDLVRVKENANEIDCGLNYVDDMLQYLGNEYEVKEVCDDVYQLVGCKAYNDDVNGTGYWLFDEKWLESANELFNKFINREIRIHISENDINLLDEFQEMLGSAHWADGDLLNSKRSIGRIKEEKNVYISCEQQSKIYFIRKISENYPPTEFVELSEVIDPYKIEIAEDEFAALFEGA